MRQNPHVRICGGPGSATTLVYPTAAPAKRCASPGCGSDEKPETHGSGAGTQLPAHFSWRVAARHDASA